MGKGKAMGEGQLGQACGQVEERTKKKEIEREENERKKMREKWMRDAQLGVAMGGIGHGFEEEEEQKRKIGKKKEKKYTERGGSLLEEKERERNMWRAKKGKMSRWVSGHVKRVHGSSLDPVGRPTTS